MKMIRITKFISALLFASVSSVHAASYTTLTQGLDKTATPYNIGINLNGIWYNFATITAGGVFNLPIASGGTGQATASAAFNALSPMTTAGDLIYGGASGAGTRLPAGANTQFLMSGTTPSWITMSGDATLAATGALTLATVNANVGSWGSATQAPQITVDGKGRITAAANVTVTPAIGSITGLGAGFANAAAIATNANGGFATVSVSTTAPSTPSLFQPWLNTTATPYVWNIWDGASWIALGTINATTHALAIPAASISWTQTGTGAAVRSVDAKLKDYFSLQDFGGNGNGSFDNCTAFTNAAAAASSVYIPPGTYSTSCSVPIHSQKGFYADLGSVWIQQTTANIPVVKADDNASRCFAKGLQLSHTAQQVHFVGSVSGTTLTISSVSSGALAAGQTIWPDTSTNGTANIAFTAPPVTIVSGSGTTWTLSASQTIASQTYYGSSVQAGGDGLDSGNSTASCDYENLFAINNYVGFNLHNTALGTIVGANAQLNASDGFKFSNPVALGASGNTVQWWPNRDIATNNGGNGFQFLSNAVGGLYCITLSGSLNNLYTFSNSGRGVLVQGNATTGVCDFMLNGGFFGTDALEEIRVDAYADNNTNNIKGANTEINNSGDQILITGNNGTFAVDSVQVSSPPSGFAGLKSLASNTTVTSPNLLCNTALPCHTGSTGLVLQGTSPSAIGGRIVGFSTGALITSGANALYSGVNDIANTTTHNIAAGTTMYTASGFGLGTSVLSIGTVSGAASIAFTGLDAWVQYNSFRVDCSNLTFSSASTFPQIQFGEGAGPTWKTTAYTWAGTGMITGGAAVDATSAGDGGVSLSLGRAVNGTVANQVGSFSATLYDATKTLYKTITEAGTVYDATGAAQMHFSISGSYTGDTAAITAIRLIPTTGTVSGTCILYGQ